VSEKCFAFLLYLWYGAGEILSEKEFFQIFQNLTEFNHVAIIKNHFEFAV
jgi:hypothetical protein